MVTRLVFVTVKNGRCGRVIVLPLLAGRVSYFKVPY